MDEAVQSIQHAENNAFLPDGEFRSLGLYKVNGTGTYTYAAEEDLKMIHELFLEASKEKGIVNMNDPELAIEIEYKNHSKEKVLLWLGEEGQESVIEKIDIMNDLQTVYSIPEKLAGIFRTLADRIEEVDSK